MATWYNLRTFTKASKNAVMTNFEALLSGQASVTAGNFDSYVYIGVGSIPASSAFQVDVTDKTSQPWPVVTTVQKGALTGSLGAACYDSSATSLYLHDGNNWVAVS